MNCPCGKPVKLVRGKGRPSQFCSTQCANRYRKQKQREREANNRDINRDMIPFSESSVNNRDRGDVTKNRPLPSWLTPTMAKLMLAPIREVAARKQTYLDLPQPIRAVAHDPLYEKACPYGVVTFEEAQYTENAAGELQRVPYVSYERCEVLDTVDTFIRPPEREKAIMVPLAWRVGLSIGWLSALCKKQPRETFDGLIILSALVKPLLIESRSATEVGSYERHLIGQLASWRKSEDATLDGDDDVEMLGKAQSSASCPTERIIEGGAL